MALASTPPDRGTRFAAFLIDSLIAGVLANFFFVGGLLGAVYLVIRDGLTLNIMNERSLGKHLMNLKVERDGGRSMAVETSVRRNWMWGLGPVAATASSVPLFGGFLSVGVAFFGLAVGLYEAFRVLTRDDGRRLGDELARTQVTAE